MSKCCQIAIDMMILTNCKVASSSLSWLVAHSRIFRLFMKGKFDTYLLWPLTRRVQNWIEDQSTACYFTVYCVEEPIFVKRKNILIFIKIHWPELLQLNSVLALSSKVSFLVKKYQKNPKIIFFKLENSFKLLFT